MNKIIDTLFGQGRWKLFVEGYFNTIVITVFAVLIGVIIGTLLAICKVLPKNRWWQIVLDKFASVYLAVIRGTPIMVQLMIFYFLLTKNIPMSPLLIAIVGFGINSGAYVAEIMRSGIMSIEKGQMEAGRSLGLSYGKTMIKIILPQAVKNILPALGNEAIVLIKETSVASVVTVTEFFNAAKYITSATYDYITPYLFIALVYFLTVMLLSFLLSKFEKKLRSGDAR